MSLKVDFTERRHRSRSPDSSSSGSSDDSRNSWSFGKIRSSSSLTSSETEIFVRRQHKPPAMIKAPFPVKPKWQTKETIQNWERNRAKDSDSRIVSLDSSVATLVLDGEAWGRVPWDVVESLPSLAAVIQLAPTADHIARVRESKVAYKWMKNFSSQPLAPLPKISPTAVYELKQSKQVFIILWNKDY